jgi:hypothetical protein
MLDVKPRPRIDLARETRPSRPSRDGRPRISLVTVAVDDSPTALRELADRALHWQRLGVEFVVVCAKRQTAAVSASAIFSGARLVYGSADATLAQLRSLGLAAAGGDVVVLVDSDDPTDEGWIEQLCASHRGRSEGEHG